MSASVPRRSRREEHAQAAAFRVLADRIEANIARLRCTAESWLEHGDGHDGSIARAHIFQAEDGARELQAALDDARALVAEMEAS